MEIEQFCNLDERGLNQLVRFMLHNLQGTTKESFISTAIRNVYISLLLL
jgi:hypothetical protein